MPLRPSLTAVSLAAVALAVASPAHAGPPPLGKYECVIGASQILFGDLFVKGGKRYAHRGTKGVFTAISGKRFRLKGGDLGGMRGRWYRDSSGGIEVALRNPKDDFESIYCSKV